MDTPMDAEEHLDGTDKEPIKEEKENEVKNIHLTAMPSALFHSTTDDGTEPVDGTGTAEVGSQDSQSSMHSTRSTGVKIVVPPQEEHQPETDDQKKAERKARLKKTRNIRFTIDDTKYVPEKSEIVEEEGRETDIEGRVRGVRSTISAKSVQMDREYEEAALREMLTEDEDIDALLNDDEDYEDDENEERQPIKGGDAIKAKTEFLNYFEIPSLSDISEEHTSEEERALKSLITLQQSIGSQIIDTGRFVNPLTGESIHSIHSTASSSSSSTSSSSIELGMDDDDDGMGRMSSFNELSELKSISKPVEDDDMEVFVKFQQSFIKQDSIVEDEDEKQAVKLKNEILKITIDFLYELFNNVVTDSEVVQERDALKNKLDKQKLHASLKEERDEYLYTREINNYLNNKMCDYYKRMKNIRVLSKLSPADSEKERIRYQEALTQLDKVLNVASETKKQNAYLMSSVLMDLTYVQNICMYTEEHFEEVMHRTLVMKSSEFLRRLTERELRLMGQKRNEISDTRLFLITRKHTLGRITDRIKKLEQINEDLCMDDFISIQNQVVALDKKIEERNIELKKLRYNYHTELHLTQHNREKAFALESKLQIHKANLVKTQRTQQKLRESLYKSKLERARMRKLHSDLSFQGGLLAMPALMHDYDETVEKVMLKRANVKELKETYKRLNQRIIEMESRCV